MKMSPKDVGASIESLARDLVQEGASFRRGTKEGFVSPWFEIHPTNPRSAVICGFIGDDNSDIYIGAHGHVELNRGWRRAFGQSTYEQAILLICKSVIQNGAIEEIWRDRGGEVAKARLTLEVNGKRFKIHNYYGLRSWLWRKIKERHVYEPYTHR